MGETSSKITDRIKSVSVKQKTKAKKQKKFKGKQFAKAAKTKHQERIDALTHYDLTSYDDDIL